MDVDSVSIHNSTDLVADRENSAAAKRPRYDTADFYAAPAKGHTIELFPINLLPAEVLSIIFSNFGLHPRLHVISLVCKRWRRQALQSITSISFSRRTQTAAFPLLPSLSSLRVKQCILEALVPTTLTALDVRLDDEWIHRGPCLCCSLTVLADLRALSLSNTFACNCLEPLVMRSRTTLGHLSLAQTLSRYVSDHHREFLRTVHLPQLRSLRLDISSNEVVLWMTLTHAQQLTSLRCWPLSRMDDLPKGGLLADFPLLEELECPLPYLRTMDKLTRLRRLMVRLDGSDWGDMDLCRKISGIPTEVHLPLLNAQWAVLARDFLTTAGMNIRAIYGDPDRDDLHFGILMLSAVSIRFGENITSLSLRRGLRGVLLDDAARLFPNLKYLCSSGETLECTSHTFPKLESLHWFALGSGIARELGLFLPWVPRLRVLQLTLMEVSDEESEREFMDLLKDLNRRGVGACMLLEIPFLTLVNL